MSYFGAALWITGIHLSFLWMLAGLVALRESTSRDFVAVLACQLIAYALGLFLLLRAHGPHTRIRDFVAWRSTHGSLPVLGALLGVAVAIPATVLFNSIERRWPSEEPPSNLVSLFFEAGPLERVLIGAGVMVIGPFVEEVLFRGAIFGPLRVHKEPAPVILVTAAYFAFVHEEPRQLVPIFLVGLVLGYIRAASGSILPSLSLHMAFNVLPFLSVWEHDPTAPQASTDVEPGLVLGAIAACLVLVVAIQFVATRSRKATAARRADLAGMRVD